MDYQQYLHQISAYKGHINRLKAKNKKLKDSCKIFEAMIAEFQAELKALTLTISLIKNHATIDFDNNLLGLIAEIEKDPIGFEKALKGESNE